MKEFFGMPNSDSDTCRYHGTHHADGEPHQHDLQQLMHELVEVGPNAVG